MINTKGKPMTKIPTTIMTGFLGSGKTTIVSSLVEEMIAKGEMPVYIKNEIGSEDIDSEIMRGKNIKTKELLNGCICCTLVGPFVNSINEVIEKFNPDRIIIEASGAADPSAIALMVSSHPALIRDSVITIVDVDNFEGYKDISETARHQAKFTDIIVFNKIEMVDLNRKRAVVGYVRELNEHSPIVEAPGGKIDSSLVFGVSSKELEDLLLIYENDKNKLKDQKHDEYEDHSNHKHSHLDADNMKTFHYSFDEEISKKDLKEFLEGLPNNFIRVKGFVVLSAGDRQLVNKVGKRVDFIDVEDEQLGKKGIKKLQSTLVFIGFGVDQYQDGVVERLRGVL